ncbi:NACHT, LRR and PYD domains-containing protein 6-like [Morone saxatilis]|uniref:NACHT, LRR and PYD domains-containing protein 6-like n=1 Tax=Morone saxatilis TaxID=34816 RepID=UPI0015E2219F|nr:NACHT, LRR and PYD domains-containing protein 6-like [Morone saxatilis]
MKRFNETSVRGKTGATMTKEVLLSNLDDLGEDDFKRFKWFLKDERLKDSSTIPWNKLEKAKTWETVDLMIQTYTLPGAVEVTKQVLKKINRNDLLQSLETKVDVNDVGKTLENRGPSSSQWEGKTPVFSDGIVYQKKLQSNFQDKFMCAQEGQQQSCFISADRRQLGPVQSRTGARWGSECEEDM